MSQINSQTIGKLIVIEGLDGGGKKTQSKLLFEHLQQEGYKAHLISFPLYDTAAGKLIAAYLRGEVGKKEEIPPELPSLFYAMDRYQAKWEIEQLLQQGYMVVADRYSPSNLAFQGAKFDGEKRIEFLAWLEALESRLPQPDKVFFLNVPLETTQEWVQKRQQRAFEITELKDIYERDFSYQQQVRAMYLQLAKEHRWEVINYAQDDNSIRSRESIHKEIWEKVEIVL